MLDALQSVPQHDSDNWTINQALSSSSVWDLRVSKPCIYNKHDWVKFSPLFFFLFRLKFRVDTTVMIFSLRRQCNETGLRRKSILRWILITFWMRSESLGAIRRSNIICFVCRCSSVRPTVSRMFSQRDISIIGKSIIIVRARKRWPQRRIIIYFQLLDTRVWIGSECKLWHKLADSCYAGRV